MVTIKLSKKEIDRTWKQVTKGQSFQAEKQHTDENFGFIYLHPELVEIESVDLPKVFAVLHFPRNLGPGLRKSALAYLLGKLYLPKPVPTIRKKPAGILNLTKLVRLSIVYFICGLGDNGHARTSLKAKP